jgi:hypothetical protein
MGSMEIFAFALNLAVILLLLWFLMFLIKLESTGCECALSWRRSFIMFAISLTILLNIIKLAFKSWMELPIFQYLFPVILTIHILFVTFAIQYIRHLKQVKCDCSKDNARDVLEIYAWIQVILFVFIAVQLIYLATILRKISLNNTKSTKKISKR